jgi:predicted permease
VARLKPGVTPEHAAALLDAAIRGPGKHKPAPAGSAGTWLERRFAPEWKSGLLYGGGLALVLGLVLFVACVNVAQLRLAQAETRKKELGIQMALGAGPGRITRQLLTETAVVSAAGSALGLFLAQVFIDRVSAFVATSGLPLDLGIRLDYRVLAFTLLAATASVFLAGLAPARYAVRLDVAEVLKSEQVVGNVQRGRLRKAFIAGQVAVSVMLFGVALLFLQSFRNAAAIHPGLDPNKKLLVMMVCPGWDSRITFWCEQACARLAGLPGVRGATFARRLPLADSGGGATVRVEMPFRAPLGVGFNNVAGNYFAMMGTHVLAGRGIDANDREGSPLVVVASQRFERQAFGTRNPLGEWVSVDGKKRQIVGIAEDAPSNDLHEATQPFLYLPFAQSVQGDITLLVETAGQPEQLERAIRHELKQFDSRVTVYQSMTLREHMQHALLSDRFMAGLSTSMGVFGFLLTGAGLFAAIQYAVNRRTREIGLRVALGARPSEILWMVLGESLRMAAWGIAIGMVLLAVAAWSARSLVLGVHPLNPAAYLGGSAAAVAIALLAAWWPAARATRVDPISALRSE